MKKYFSRSFLGWLCMAAALACIPIFVKSLHWLNILIFANIFVLFTVSWDISSGHTGYLSLGHGFFIGLGGYTSGILTHHLGVPLYPSIILASIITMVVGTGLIVPALRIRGPYFLMFSFALPLLLIKIVRMGAMRDITGGHLGLFPLPTFAPVPERAKVYYFTLIIALVIGYVLWKVSRSRIGDVLKAIYNDEELVESLGINIFKYKLFSFMVCTLIAGLGGALWVHYMGSVSPANTLAIYIMIEVLLAVLIGGEGTIVGPILGAYFCIILMEALRPFAFSAWRLLIFTLIGVSLIAIKPTGVSMWILNYVDRAMDMVSVKKIKD